MFFYNQSQISERSLLSTLRNVKTIEPSRIDALSSIRLIRGLNFSYLLKPALDRLVIHAACHRNRQTDQNQARQNFNNRRMPRYARIAENPGKRATLPPKLSARSSLEVKRIANIMPIEADNEARSTMRTRQQSPHTIDGWKTAGLMANRTDVRMAIDLVSIHWTQQLRSEASQLIKQDYYEK